MILKEMLNNFNKPEAEEAALTATKHLTPEDTDAWANAWATAGEGCGDGALSRKKPSGPGLK